MKIRILPILIALCALASCEESARVSCKIELQVNDDGSKPVVGAQASVRYPVGIKVNPGGGFPTDRHETTRTETDATGKASLSYSTVSSPEGLLWVRKDGYYDTIYRDPIWGRSPGSTNEWICKLDAILKPIKNPIPMIASTNLRIRTPEFGVPYGFDLEMGESLPPFGNGKMADLTFILTGSRTKAADPGKEVIDFRTEIRCMHPDDGLVEFMAEDTREFSKGSKLPSAHEAPANGYVPSIIRTMATDADGGLAGATSSRHADAPKCYYFRVRTKRDANGEIISANYGKMYGPLEIRPALTRYGHDTAKGQGGFFIQYLYFNPTPNDRNVEFDPKRNLNPNGNVLHP